MGRSSTRTCSVVGGPHLGPDRRLARLVLERYREAITGDVRMNCDLCTYRVRLPGYEDKVGTPISLTPHGDGPARGGRRVPPGHPRARRAASRSRSAGLRSARRRWSRCRRARRRRSSSRASPTRIPTAAPRSPASTCSSPPAERLAVLGPNGAGKTTLALAVCGALDDVLGRVSVSGVTLAHDTRREIRRRAGIVFQDVDDQLFMPTVEEDVAFGPANQG